MLVDAKVTDAGTQAQIRIFAGGVGPRQRRATDERGVADPILRQLRARKIRVVQEARFELRRPLGVRAGA